MDPEPPQDDLTPELQAAVAAYHQPPPTPRRELWLRLQQARAIRRARPSRWQKFSPVAWATGVAALLALGVGIGRLSVRRQASPPSSVASNANRPVSTAADEITTTAYLQQAHLALTLFRTSVNRGGVDSLTLATARQLLATDRLLIDSPAATDPRIRLLLEDLELVLAQITQLPSQPAEEDLELISDGIQRTGLMVRLGRQVSAEPVATSSS